VGEDQSIRAAINKYLADVKQQHETGQAVEHAYRPALKTLMQSFDDTVAVNDPKHSEHGAPDFVFLKASSNSIIKGYAEAKDIGKPLDKVEKSDQMLRYAGYANLFLTDYLEFRFYKNGEKYKTVSLGYVNKGAMVLTPENGERLWGELRAFLTLPPERITSGQRLAEIMGAKARRIRDDVVEFVQDEMDSAKTGANKQPFEILKMYQLMRTMLVHDLNPKKFADMYAQTIVYGLFTARYMEESPESFSRAEARDLVPKSNPFLRQFFDHIAGAGFDERLAVSVDELSVVFQISDVRDIVHRHLRIHDESKGDKDPIIHFYEDFLRAYDPVQKKSMGAYYTPTPVVKFIVRNIDRILKEDFGISQGLGSTEQVTYEVATQPWRKKGERKDRLTKEIKGAKVQILDPAVGTATFLNETIIHIHKSFKGQEGRWPAYVRDNLMPRLYGFELMMAPYTIAHLKLGMTLRETGVDELSGRLNVFLTNTLEEGVPTQPDLFSFGLAEAVSEESRLAAEVKQEKPVMVVMGNPPYSGISSNETTYANSLVKRYKVEPGGSIGLQEKKHWLNDDYVKFLAFAEDMVTKNGTGVVGMITNNGYLDNPTFRGMRWHLATTFDRIYVLDLHGSANKQEKAPDGGADENVFDIMQGVGILLAVKTGEKSKKALAKVFHAEIYGVREKKFAALFETQEWKQVEDTDGCYFKPMNLVDSSGGGYTEGVAINELFLKSGLGIVSGRDRLCIDFDADVLQRRVDEFAALDIEDARARFSLGDDSTTWSIERAQKDLREHSDDARLSVIQFRPFDYRFCHYMPNSSGFIVRPNHRVMRHFLQDEGKNIGLVTTRFQKKQPGAFISQNMITHKVFNSYDSNSIFPLWFYHADGTKMSNLDPTRLKILSSNLSREPEPDEVLDYIYALLHSPTYREQYAEFMRVDFPRIPVIPGNDEFARLVSLGNELRLLHLMVSPVLDNPGTTFPVRGDDSVEKVTYKNERVFINKEQYFGNVPKVAWDFHVGGYQPARKWLNERRGRQLSDDDLWHYQRIIKTLVETDRLMSEIG
jgi:predicted helicase